jgi:8-oxo-dGTP diphosphatase
MGDGSGVVHAAGGVVLRDGVDAPEVLLVHRPRYDDWTLPKGKAEPGEDPAATALREVVEETGYDCVLGRELPSTTYEDDRGRPKIVRYWIMRPTAGAFVANEEVDAIEWRRLDEAVPLLTYERDRAVLGAVDLDRDLA